jgi:NADPH-dependent 2,4-dienoyl-CoA reductase/sulfur reductase-like enzyme
MQHIPYLILGGGVAAGYAARQFVDSGLEAGSVGIISADRLPPYERPPLSKAFLAGEKSLDDIFINAPEFYSKHGISLYLNTLITKVDFNEKRLIADGGQEFSYDKLLIATGARIRKLGLPGEEADGIYYLRRAEHSKHILKEAGQVKQAAVIGGGYIGMEVSATLARHGLDVTVIYPDRQLMSRLFTHRMSEFFEHYYKKRGVNLASRTRAAGFSVEDGRVRGVLMSSGEEIPAQLVVIGVGVIPATELFEGTPLRVEGGIRVNETLQTNLPDVFVAGDVACHFDPRTKRYRRLEHWDNAVQQGRHAAKGMLGQIEEYRYVPYFFSDIFDLSYEFWGSTDDADQTVHRGNLDSGKFSVWWLREGHVIGAFLLNRPAEEREVAKNWVKNEKVVPARKLRNSTEALGNSA